MGRRRLAWVAVGLAGGVALGYATYRHEINRAYERVRGQGKVIPSPFGDIEYAEGGAGVPVLVSHGSGGGYDQGQLIAETFLDDRFHWLAPSRFGYLRSTSRAGATFDDQAHAYGALLDHLNLDQVAVIALSHGGPAALLFALLYPERISSLTLLSAGVAATGATAQAEANRKGNALTTIYRHDWLYWLVTRLFRRQFLGLMGASQEVIAGLTSAQRELVERIVEEMNPVSPRAAGVTFDNRAALPGRRIATIRAPTLIVHAADDLLQLYDNAAFAAETIPRARLLRFERGGHLLLAVEQPTIRTAVQEHILQHVMGSFP
jgi:pimeloyl-ACP methyl ester carboxylesterase